MLVANNYAINQQRNLRYDRSITPRVA